MWNNVKYDWCIKSLIFSARHRFIPAGDDLIAGRYQSAVHVTWTKEPSMMVEIQDFRVKTATKTSAPNASVLLWLAVKEGQLVCEEQEFLWRSEWKRCRHSSRSLNEAEISTQLTSNGWPLCAPQVSFTHISKHHGVDGNVCVMLQLQGPSRRRLHLPLRQLGLLLLFLLLRLHLHTPSVMWGCSLRIFVGVCGLCQGSLKPSAAGASLKFTDHRRLWSFRLYRNSRKMVEIMECRTPAPHHSQGDPPGSSFSKFVSRSVTQSSFIYRSGM